MKFLFKTLEEDKGKTRYNISPPKNQQTYSILIRSIKAPFSQRQTEMGH